LAGRRGRRSKQLTNDKESRGEISYKKIKRRKANCIGLILGNNCLLKHVEGKIKGYNWREDEKEEASS
jgi:hypothetical protein